MPGKHHLHESKRNNGNDMAHVRHVVDYGAGERRRIETTREARRRYQRQGAQVKPTKGQINAAEIWNKQEEKIRRDKEREEKRKRLKLRQEEKDMRLQELQREKLRAGKISLEDTWGKVNASQNRLHRFFGAPKEVPYEHPAHNEDNKKLLNGDGDENFDDTTELMQLEGEPAFVSEGEHLPIPTSTSIKHDRFLHNLDQVFTSSPLSPDLERSISKTVLSIDPKPDTCSIIGDSHLPVDRPLPPTRSDNEADKQCYQPITSVTTVTSISMSEQQHQQTWTAGESEVWDYSQSESHRPPLAEMTESEINIRASQKPESPVHVNGSSNERAFPTTQVVRDTILGLCSQDFEDDYDYDRNNDVNKENRSPSDTSAPGAQGYDSTSTELHEKNKDRLQDDQHLDNDADTFHSNDLSTKIDEDHDLFDDDAIDDESLLMLAATQPLRPELYAADLKTKIDHDETHENTCISSITAIQAAPNDPEQVKEQLINAVMGDSFAVDGLDDDDLLEGLENYEDTIARPIATGILTAIDNNAASTGALDAHIYQVNVPSKTEISTRNSQMLFQQALPPNKKRRVLPWIRNPVSEIMDVDVHDSVTSSPPSPSLGD